MVNWWWCCECCSCSTDTASESRTYPSSLHYHQHHSNDDDDDDADSSTSSQQLTSTTRPAVTDADADTRHRCNNAVYFRLVQFQFCRNTARNLSSPATSPRALLQRMKCIKSSIRAIVKRCLYALGVPRRQPHRRSGLATLPSVGAIP